MPDANPFFTVLFYLCSAIAAGTVTFALVAAATAIFWAAWHHDPDPRRFRRREWIGQK
jgi:hypothetical protein